MQNNAKETKYEVSYRNLFIPHEAKLRTPHIFLDNTILYVFLSSPI